jgi:hypothetical protein
MVQTVSRMFFGPFASSEEANAWMERTGQAGVVHRLIEPFEPKAEPEQPTGAVIHLPER